MINPDDFIRRIQIGVTFGKLKLAHLIGNYYVLSIGGSTYTSGQTSCYGRAEHVVLDLSKDDGNIGFRTYCKTKMGLQVEGRLNKAIKSDWIVKLSQIKENTL